MEQVEQQVYAFLDQLNIKYDKFPHEPMYTIEAAAEIDKKIGVPICKNLFLSTKHQSEFYLLFMQGHKKFRTGKVSKQIEVPRMTFGSDEHMQEFLHLMPGSVSPMGLIFDTEKKVQFLLDSSVLDMEYVSMHPCVNTMTIVMKTTDLLQVALPACGHTIRTVLVEE